MVKYNRMYGIVPQNVWYSTTECTIKYHRMYGKVLQCLRYNPVLNVPKYHMNPSSTAGIYYRYK